MEWPSLSRPAPQGLGEHLLCTRHPARLRGDQHPAAASLEPCSNRGDEANALCRGPQCQAGGEHAQDIILKKEGSTGTKSSSKITHLAMDIFVHLSLIFKCFKAQVFFPNKSFREPQHITTTTGTKMRPWKRQKQTFCDCMSSRCHPLDTPKPRQRTPSRCDDESCHQ